MRKADIIRFKHPRPAKRFIRRTWDNVPPVSGYVVGLWIDNHGVTKYKFKFFNELDCEWKEVSVNASSVEFI